MSARRVLERTLTTALASIDVEARVRRAVARLLPSERVRIVAVGKVAPAMARGALAALGGRAAGALVVAPDGVALGDLDATIVRAAHPLPDARSVRAAERAIVAARAAARERSVLLALVSGGASALLCAPYRTTLARKIATVRALLRARATVKEINLVRRHASRVKGGALLRAARPARVVTIVVSDVIGGDAHDVGSGPTLPDPSTRATARAVVARHGAPAIPLRASAAAPRSRDARRSSVRVVASCVDLAREARAALARSGYRVRLAPPSTASVESLAARYAALARTLAPGEALVRVAEPTLAVRGARPGRGGRCSHLAALVAPHLPRGVVFMAAASDGVDGTSGAAGAIVDRASWSRLDRASVVAALARFDSATLHARVGTALRTGPTGQNFADLHVLVRVSRAPSRRSRLRRPKAR